MLAVLDEADSGLDIDSLKLVGENIEKMHSGKFSALIITHYPRLLQYVKTDLVHVIADGKIVKSGSAQLAHEIEKRGYAALGIAELDAEPIPSEVEAKV